MKYIGIDIGGTWIKGTVVDETFFSQRKLNKSEAIEIKKVKSPLHESATPNELIIALKELIANLGTDFKQVGGIGISTAGVVNYEGTKVLKATAHLNVLKTDSWKTELERQLQCHAIVINDSDAATIGIAELGLLKGNKTVGVMPIGTGLGFTVWRNGRRWQAGKTLCLLGSIRTPSGSYNDIASASKLATKDADNNLIEVLTKNKYSETREDYLDNLVSIINSAAIIYSLDEVIICGGLTDAAMACNFELEHQLNLRLAEQQLELDKIMKTSVVKEGNKLQLIGAVSLAKAESVARKQQVSKIYSTIPTEIPYQKGLQLQNLSTEEVVKQLWTAEQEAGICLEKSFPFIVPVIDEIAERVGNGGRLIYVGAGTSGRVAAMDAVELPCTYGFPEDKVLSLIAGGIVDASIEIESNFEEDASAVPEMLFLDVSTQDTVIGISASGTAYFVQSALAFAKERGAYSVMIQSEQAKTKLPFCDTVIPLHSGYEVVAGSTRMKAGTATKKILNFISSSVMIKMGKVAGSYMVDMACINHKLIERAQSILGILYKMDKEEAFIRLEKADMSLSGVIRNIEMR